jgi:hypothetical protein
MLSLAPSVVADQTFHTQQIALMPVDGAPLRTGFVVDVHANGPQVAALERYVLTGAAPDASYQVQLRIFGNGTCSGSPFLVIPTATLVTNVSGNAEGSFVFPPNGGPPTTIFIVWQVLRQAPTGSQLAYQTACITVALD